MSMSDQMPQQDNKLARIEQKLDRDVTSEVIVSMEAGGVAFKSVLEQMEYAKLMALSQQGVPPHLRGNPGFCLAIIAQSVEWKCSPWSVANKSYVVNDRLSYESQLVHAVIEQRAPIQGRIRHEFIGEGPTRRCRVWAIPKGETEALEYISPEFQSIKPKNSPLWTSKPDLQLYYNAVRDFARVYFPDVLLGIYSKDEIEDNPDLATAPSPNLLERLPGRVEGAGFGNANVDNGVSGNDHGDDQAGGDAQTDANVSRETLDRSGPNLGPNRAKNKGKSGPAKPSGKAKGAVKQDRGSKAAAKAKNTPPDTKAGRDWAAKPPTNAKDYKAYVTEWLAEATSASAITDRFQDERKLRNACGMVADETTKIRSMIDDRLAELH